MRHLLTVVLFAAAAFAQDAPLTYHNVLGKDGVESVMKAVISEAEARFSSSYLVTDEAVNRLKADGVPDRGLTLLGNLKGREFRSREEFLRALRLTLGRREAERLRVAVLANTQGYLVVTDEFFNPVESLILATEVMEPGTAGRSLDAGFRKFLNNYIAHLKETSGNTNRLTLRDQNLLGFIDALRAKCNESPCDMPPCCDLCKKCKKS